MTLIILSVIIGAVILFGPMIIGLLGVLFSRKDRDQSRRTTALRGAMLLTMRSNILCFSPRPSVLGSYSSVSPSSIQFLDSQLMCSTSPTWRAILPNGRKSDKSSQATSASIADAIESALQAKIGKNITLVKAITH